MKLDELADEYRLNLAVLDIADRVKEVSGKGIDFRPTPKLGVRARTKMARRQTPQHVIFFNLKERPHLSHILAHECARILRMVAIPAEDSRVPASTPQTLGAARDEIQGEAGHLPADLRDEAVDMWIHGLITQLTSQPIDARIEKWISASYPGLRDEQRRSLRTEIRTITASISPSVKRTAPASIFQRSHALNYAYLDHIGDIMGRSFDSTFRGHPDIVTLGKTLSDLLNNDDLSDQELVNRIAEAVQIRDWFVWLGSEDLPNSYHTT